MIIPVWPLTVKYTIYQDFDILRISNILLVKCYIMDTNMAEACPGFFSIGAVLIFLVLVEAEHFFIGGGCTHDWRLKILYILEIVKEI